MFTCHTVVLLYMFSNCISCNISSSTAYCMHVTYLVRMTVVFLHCLLHARYASRPHDCHLLSLHCRASLFLFLIPQHGYLFNFHWKPTEWMSSRILIIDWLGRPVSSTANLCVLFSTATCRMSAKSYKNKFVFINIKKLSFLNSF